MSGQRVHPDKFGQLRLPAGGYGCDLRGRWWLRPAGADARPVAGVDVRPHADGTITVSGYLLNGNWRAT